MKNYIELENGYIQLTDEEGKVWTIPNDPANSDYQRYLRWLENPETDETQGGMN